MTDWHPNPGYAPIFRPRYPEELCPPNEIHELEAPNARVFVRLKNGREPAESWPVSGGTKWQDRRYEFDIAEWRRA